MQLSPSLLSNLFFGRSTSDDGQRFLAPEIIQTSAMDCGPAALSCLLTGFDIPVSYGRLREACQTDVDGTSINMIEDMARSFGLQAEQVIAPVDHLTLPEASLLPALVVTALPGGLPHFVVVWNLCGPFVQVMNPAVGRQWIRKERFQRELYRYVTPFPATIWRTWAASAGFLGPLRSRLDQLELSAATRDQLLDEATANPDWYPLATLDAATRFVQSLVTARGIYVGSEAESLLQSLVAESSTCDPTQAESPIPQAYWSVRPVTAPHDVAAGRNPDGEEPPLGNATDPELKTMLLFSGAVLMQVRGPQKQRAESGPGSARAATPGPSKAAHAAVPNQTVAAAEEKAEERDQSTAPDRASGQSALPLLHIPSSTEHQPERTIWQTLRAHGHNPIIVVLFATALSAGAVTMEAALLRALMTVAEPLVLAGQSAVLLGLCLFIGLLLLLEWPLANLVQQLGRGLEIQLRMKLLAKIPRLSDRYFHSRLVSDMAERAHSLHSFHSLPDLAVRLVRISAQLLFTAGAIIWLHPGSATLVVGLVVLTFAMLLSTQPLLAERDMRVRTHTGALSRFYLDALLGLMPIRTHSAARAVRREHEARLVDWTRTSRDLDWLQQISQTAGSLISLGFAIAIIFHYLGSSGEASAVLLLLYWTLNLPMLSQRLFDTIQQYPVQRNRMARLLEPLNVPEEENEQLPSRQLDNSAAKQADSPPSPPHHSPALSLKDVTVRAGGHVLLDGIDLEIEPGEHVAIVGASGAGKSTLAGLLLGWHRPAAGQLLVDGEPLIGKQVDALRRQTAWIDPSVQLWNRSLYANLLYGAEDEAAVANRDPESADGTALGLDAALASTDLYPLLARFPGGLSTQLGENGGLISGGEGQRVRMGRALLRANVRLAILDEPFRGLDRTTRQQLLANTRTHWQTATLLCITHDVSDTQDFDRVLVVAEGHIVEDGRPARLLADPTSHYRHLLAAEKTVQQTLWEANAWQHLWLEDGLLVSDAPVGEGAKPTCA